MFIVLSFGAIYALIPLLIILILIAAAAGLNRGANIFEVFGFATLSRLAVGSGLAGRGISRSSKYRTNTKVTSGAAGKLGGSGRKYYQQKALKGMEDRASLIDSDKHAVALEAALVSKATSTRYSIAESGKTAFDRLVNKAMGVEAAKMGIGVSGLSPEARRIIRTQTAMNMLDTSDKGEKSTQVRMAVASSIIKDFRKTYKAKGAKRLIPDYLATRSKRIEYAKYPEIEKELEARRAKGTGLQPLVAPTQKLSKATRIKNRLASPRKSVVRGIRSKAADLRGFVATQKKVYKNTYGNLPKVRGTRAKQAFSQTKKFYTSYYRERAKKSGIPAFNTAFGGAGRATIRGAKKMDRGVKALWKNTAGRKRKRGTNPATP